MAKSLLNQASGASGMLIIEPFGIIPLASTASIVHDIELLAGGRLLHGLARGPRVLNRLHRTFITRFAGAIEGELLADIVLDIGKRLGAARR